MLLGLFAYKSVNAAGANGLFAGNAAFFGKQVAAALITAVYSFGMTFIILKFIGVFGSIRVPDAVEMKGLDSELHGEEAYVLD
jgi:Amt family ammonium transporter